MRPSQRNARRVALTRTCAVRACVRAAEWQRRRSVCCKRRSTTSASGTRTSATTSAAPPTPRPRWSCGRGWRSSTAPRPRASSPSGSCSASSTASTRSSSTRWSSSSRPSTALNARWPGRAIVVNARPLTCGFPGAQVQRLTETLEEMRGVLAEDDDKIKRAARGAQQARLQVIGERTAKLTEVRAAPRCRCASRRVRTTSHRERAAGGGAIGCLHRGQRAERGAARTRRLPRAQPGPIGRGAHRRGFSSPWPLFEMRSRTRGRA